MGRIAAQHATPSKPTAGARTNHPCALAVARARTSDAIAPRARNTPRADGSTLRKAARGRDLEGWVGGEVGLMCVARICDCHSLPLWLKSAFSCRPPRNAMPRRALRVAPRRWEA